MKQNQDTQPYFSGRVYRWFSGLFGAFLVVVGIYAMFFGVVSPVARISVGLLIAVLGAESIWAGINARQSWLAKLGPFY